jgi:hypothetical protein
LFPFTTYLRPQGNYHRHDNLSFDILHDYLSKKIFFSALDDLAPPSEEPHNMKSETHLVNNFHLIYYMTTFIKPYCFALDDLAPPPRKGPKI